MYENETRKVNHRCPVQGCTRLRKQQQVMCRQHWYKVPKELRTRVWALFTYKRASDEHRAAVLEAIRVVSELEQETAQP